MKLLVVIVVSLVSLGWTAPYEKTSVQPQASSSNSSIKSSSPASTSLMNQLDKNGWTVDSCIIGVLSRAEQRGRTCLCKPENMLVFGQLSSVTNEGVSCCLRSCKGDEIPISSTSLQTNAYQCCHGIAQLMKDRI